MKAHTQEKLWVYREYLKNYLSVMCNTSHWSKIFIWEPFAGAGLDENNEKGSALIAAEMIDGFKKNNGNVQLILNELDEEKYKRLKQVVSAYGDFVRVQNGAAENFLSQVNKTLNAAPKRFHNLFFIDPYGYTQYSQENLRQLLRQRNSEYLIFIPTNHIYRFKGAEDNPASKFVSDIGVERSASGTIDSFANELTEKLKEKANAEFAYNYKLEDKSVPNSVFHLFFITRHIQGAVKFLQAKNKVKDELKKQPHIQMALFDAEASEMELALRKILLPGITNRKLFQEIIKHGYLAPEISPILKRLEKEGSLEIQANFKRRKGAFYLGDDYDRITIRYKT